MPDYNTPPRVDISSEVLYFPLPVTGTIENLVRVLNREDAEVAFKVRTNAVNAYRVQPHTGFLRSKEETTLCFAYTPEKGSKAVIPEPFHKSHDWFLLDFRLVRPEDDMSSPSVFWTNVKTSTAPPPLTRIRLPCVFTETVPKNYSTTRGASYQSRSRQQSPGFHLSPSNTQGLVTPSEYRPESARGGDKEVVPRAPNPANPKWVAEEFRDEAPPASHLIRISKAVVPTTFAFLFIFLSFIAAIYGKDDLFLRVVDHFTAPIASLIFGTR